MRTAAWRLAAIALSAACGGTTGPESQQYLALSDAAASSVADATTASASSTGLDATVGAVCTGGTWALSETAGACGGCPNISDLVAIVVSDQVAAEGGTVSDDEGNTWTFNPQTCSATLTGSCDASDTIFFANGTATCTWTCGSFCPPCPASCLLTPYP